MSAGTGTAGVQENKIARLRKKDQTGNFPVVDFINNLTYPDIECKAPGNNPHHSA